MAILTIRLPDDKHLRLKKLTESQGLSINKLIEDLSTIVLVEFDTYTRFKLLAAKGNPKEDLKLLDEIRCTERIRSHSVTYHKSLILQERNRAPTYPHRTRRRNYYLFSSR